MRAQGSALRRAGLAAGAAVLLAGCGGRGAEATRSDFSKESATDILKAAATDMQALKTVRMAGQIEASGEQIGFDLQLTTQGDCQGTFKVGDGSAQIIASGGDSWMKPDHAFWTMQAGGQAAQIEGLVGDKWVAIPAESGLSSVCDLDSFLAKIKDPGNGKESSATVVGTDRVAGHDAVQVRDTGKGDDQDGRVGLDRRPPLPAQARGGGQRRGDRDLLRLRLRRHHRRARPLRRGGSEQTDGVTRE